MVVLVPCPFQGHINPMLQLATLLHKTGFFTITIIHTKFNSINDPSNQYPHFNFQSIQDGLSDQIISSGNLVNIISALNVNCKQPFHERLLQMTEQSNEVGCIIYDNLMFFAEETANHLKIKSVILRTASAATFVSRLSLIQLEKEGYFPLQDHMLQEKVSSLEYLRFKDLPLSKFGTPPEYLELIRNYAYTRTSSAVIWNTTSCIEDSLLNEIQEHSQVPIFPIGPIHMFAPQFSASLLKEDTSCRTWLDKQTPNSVLYVSLGSLASLDKNELFEIAWGLANSMQPFLWAFRPGSVDGSDSEWVESLPEGFKEAVGERGYIVKWAPQMEVLAHSAVGGFFSHCGWNSTLESICAGVPMICKPCFGDQRVNARFVSHVWRIGLNLENELERGEIERLVRMLMVDKEGDECRQRIMDLKNNIENCIAEGGSSCNNLNKFIEFIM